MASLKPPSKEEILECVSKGYAGYSKSFSAPPLEKIEKEEEIKIKAIISFISFEIYLKISKTAKKDLDTLVNAITNEVRNPETEAMTKVRLEDELLKLETISAGGIIPGARIVGPAEDAFIYKGAEVAHKDAGMRILFQIVNWSEDKETMTILNGPTKKECQKSELFFFEENKITKS